MTNDRWPERHFAPGPETHALGFVAGLTHFGGAGRGHDLAHPLAIIVDIGFDTIEFAQQNRLGVDRITGVDEIFGGANGEVVHHLQAAGNNPRRDDFSDRTAGLFYGIETGQQDFRDLGFGQQFDRDFGDDPQQTFGAGEEREQIETR